MTEHTNQVTKSRISRFTLVELLVVIGLMALIMYVVLPSFAKLAKGGGVEYSASNLVGRLGITRGYAVGKNTYAALLLPEYTSMDSSSNKRFPNKYLYNASRICYVIKVSSSTPTYNFLSWVPNETWEFMPMGSMIFRANNTKDYTPATLPAATVAAGISDGTAGTHYSVVQNVDCSKDNWSATAADYNDMDNVRAIVFSPTGKLADNAERYVKVGEGVPVPNAPLTDANLTNKQNWVNVKIDQYTGRITYGNE